MTDPVASSPRMKFCPACRERFPDDGVFCPNDGSPLVDRLPDDAHVPSSKPDQYVGREISGHIEIRELVGVGAMGRVYRAFQKGIDRDVAVKVLHRELSANPQLVARFLREAKVASRLQHPNVVHVLLSGQLPDGALYIVMEYLHGQSLQTALTTQEWDLARALHVCLQLCDAVGEAHVQGIVHRDLKPENVMLVRRGQDEDFVKVLDFGIARLNWSEQSMATATGLIFGTARYISPEGAQGEKVGPPGDVYSIATLAYQMLARRTPFEGDQAVGLLIQQIHEKPPPLRSFAAARDVPPAIADIVMRGLEKDPGARYENARAFGRALVQAARASGVTPDDYYARALSAAPSPGSGSARIATPSPSDPVVRAVAPPHPPASSSRDLGDMPVAGATAKWTPPAAVHAQLAAAHAARHHQPSSPGVEPTMDDDDLPPAQVRRAAPSQPNATPAPVVAGPGRTEMSSPTPTPLSMQFSGTVRLPSSPELPATGGRLERLTDSDIPAAPARTGPGGTLPLRNGVQAVSDRSLPTAPPRGSAPSRPGSDPHARAYDASSSAGDGSPASERGSFRHKKLAVIAACFLVGVGGATAVHRSGVLARAFGPSTSASALDAHYARTRDAVDRERWDEPPGDNAKELLSAGLRQWPNEPRLVALRNQASEALIRKAVSLRSARELRDAARLARLASEIQPENETTRALAAEYSAELERDATPLAPVVPTPVITGGKPVGPLPPNPNAPQSSAKVALETTPPKPRLGQPVQLVAKVASKSGVTEPAFVVVAPGQPQGTRLAPVSEGNTFRAGFTFLEAGRYEVSFTGKSDGAAVRSSRLIVIDAPVGNTTPDAPAAPSGSVKWL